MELFLFTNFFPFKKSEPFLVNEFAYTLKYFEKVSVLALYGETEENSLTQSNLINVYQPVFRSSEKKSDILLNGFFNLAPFGFHIRDFFRGKVFTKAKRAYWFFISFCITRAALSSRSMKNMIREIERCEKPLLYFYWGDNLAWTIPYLRKRIKNKNLKIIVRLHGSDLYENLKGNYAPLRRSIFLSCDKLYTVSEFGKKYLEERYPEFASKIEVSRLGINDHGINNERTNKVFKILSISNLVALKRVDLIAEALQLIDFPVEWHHYGDGPMAEEMNWRVKTLPPNVKVTFYGFVKNEDLIKDLQNNYYDVFINVSSSEGLPVSVMEAFSFGIPAIATNVGGTSELVNNDTGTLLNIDFTTENLAKELKRYAEFSSQKMTEKRIAARMLYERIANAKKNYSEFYTALTKSS